MSSYLNAEQMRHIRTLNNAVHQMLEDLKKVKKIRKIGYKNHSAGYRLYLAEDNKYNFFTPEGEKLQANMLGNNTVGGDAGAANIGYAVGQNTPPLPEGTWVVQQEYFLGKTFVTVHYVGALRLGMDFDF